jgi:hypothetical protein
MAFRSASEIVSIILQIYSRHVKRLRKNFFQRFFRQISGVVLVGGGVCSLFVGAPGAGNQAC